MDDTEAGEHEPGKMFVGGLSWETDEETMRPYFEQFGTVTDCVVMRDPHQLPGAKKNRGFGFVKFEDPAAVERVVAVPVHTLDSKTIDPKKALKKSGVKDTDKKVFIGGLASATTEKQVEDYFNKHYGGGVMEVVFKVDKSTQRKRDYLYSPPTIPYMYLPTTSTYYCTYGDRTYGNRTHGDEGFGFVVFKSTDYVEEVLKLQYHEIDGKKVEVKRAEPRSATASAMRHTHPSLQFPYPPAYGTPDDYRNGHHYQAQWGGGNQPYYNHAPQPFPPPHPGYGQQYSTGAGYPYDHTSAAAAYPRTQSSTGDRPDPQSYYQHQHNYGHGGAQQMGAGYGQDTTAAYAARTAYPTAQDAAAYSQQMASYGRAATQQQPPPQQQPRYGGGATGGYGH